MHHRSDKGGTATVVWPGASSCGPRVDGARVEPGLKIAAPVADALRPYLDVGRSEAAVAPVAQRGRRLADRLGSLPLVEKLTGRMGHVLTVSDAISICTPLGLRQRKFRQLLTELVGVVRMTRSPSPTWRRVVSTLLANQTQLGWPTTGDGVRHRLVLSANG